VSDISPLWKCLEIGQDSLNCFKSPSIGNILNLLMSEVAFSISNKPKTIIQMQMQQPIIDLYLAESSLVHRGKSSTSGWYLSLMGVLMPLNSLPKGPSNLGMTF
jgi:hypothetical protein